MSNILKPTPESTETKYTPHEIDPLASCGCCLGIASTGFMSLTGALIGPQIGLSRLEGATLGASISVISGAVITWWSNRKYGDTIDYDIIVNFDGEKLKE